jgi:hypothetical protein
MHKIMATRLHGSSGCPISERLKKKKKKQHKQHKHLLNKKKESRRTFGPPLPESSPTSVLRPAEWLHESRRKHPCLTSLGRRVRLHTVCACDKPAQQPTAHAMALPLQDMHMPIAHVHESCLSQVASHRARARIELSKPLLCGLRLRAAARRQGSVLHGGNRRACPRLQPGKIL